MFYRNKFLNYISNENISIHKSNLLSNIRINKSKANLLKNDSINDNSLKIYEIYENPDEDKINYIKRVYKKKYKKLISDELNTESYFNTNNNENNIEGKDIFCLEFYNTNKKRIIDLNKRNNIKNEEPIYNSNCNEKITIEFIKKKYNIIDLNQRKNDLNITTVNEEPIINTNKSALVKKEPTLNDSLHAITSSTIDTKSSASLSISKITSKESINHIITSSKLNTIENNKNLINNPNQNLNQSNLNSSLTNDNNILSPTMRLKNKSISLRSLLKTYSNIPPSPDSLNIEKKKFKENIKKGKESVKEYNYLQTDDFNKISISTYNEKDENSKTFLTPKSSFLSSTSNNISSLKDLNNIRPNSVLNNTTGNYTLLSFRKPKIFIKRRNFSK
ncbi:hypothetical protein BCR32DRAFT_298757 [Anaeromyces robustus]|uniref:Uncharacterized protein n=1 Tax=Anaeromyces robustus TaxID=1754192 RepID=A0A1Y1UHL4_9FUNG|nr:hypothetical protein BCR32DRAFT_298757 [Anaeromyces robustus]|eukprot:ORX37479.1 hypothetical protein BCR32DRAFT_298757 [Anaeromyces robustus]